MKCGYFDDPNQEYVITTPFTPVKWINYVGTLKFGGIVDHTGGAILCKGDPAFNRITKYIPQMPASDFRGSTVYIRVKEKDGWTLVAPFFTPVLKPLDHFECRVGLGYNRYIARFLGLEAEITVFVPPGAAEKTEDQVYIQNLKIRNLSPVPREVDVIPVVEFTHFDALKQLTNADWVPQTMTLNAHREGDYVLLEQYAYMKRDSAVNWFTATAPVSSFEGDRKVFLGNFEYGSWANPLALRNEELGNSTCLRGDNIGALMVKLGVLAPGTEKTFSTLLGQSPHVSEAKTVAARFRSQSAVDQAFQDLKSGWKDFLTVLQVKTPDPAFNSMVNVHNPRQCHTTKNWSRDLSLYQLGLGGRGMGYRDSSQDVLGAMSLMPEGSRELIEKILSVQKRDGSAMHQFYPLTMEASVGDSHEYPDRPHWYGDDHLWPVFSVAAYVRETGNLDFLQKELPFYDKDEKKTALEKASVWEHLKRAVRFTREHTGRHGLPLLGFADWNDTVNLPEGAESLFIANQYGKALLDMVDLAHALGEKVYADELQSAYREMQSAVEKAAWDGQWYVRYYDHQGKPLGSHTAEKGKIWINSNTWAVISGFASPDRAQTALDSVNKHLNTRFGLKLSAPGYNGYDRDIGGVTTYPPGAKENGGIFLHTNPWAIIAETLLKNGDRAFQYYQQINPAAKNDMIELYEAEPYCYPQNILGDEHPQFGLARNTWLSGTSSWTYVASTQYILGIRPELEGLRLDPCLPQAWDGFEAVRRFRGTVYRIRVKKTSELPVGQQSLLVDGVPVKGNLIHHQQKDEVSVELLLGNR